MHQLTNSSPQRELKSKEDFKLPPKGESLSSVNKLNLPIKEEEGEEEEISKFQLYEHIVMRG